MAVPMSARGLGFVTVQPLGDVRRLQTPFVIGSRTVLSPMPACTRAGGVGSTCARACWMLIGACNLMSCPIHVVRQQIKIDFDLESFVPDDSHLVDTFDIRGEYWVRQLRHHFFLSLFFSSSTRPASRRVTRPTWCPCLSVVGC